VDRASARAFVERGWEAAEALAQEHWAREFDRGGPAATLAAAGALWEHMRQVRPDWPSESERADDLAHHLALKGAIDRAAGAFLPLTGR
jgi:hypothetical protein